MREIVHIQAGQCGNQIGAKVSTSRQRNSEINDNFDTKSVKRWNKKLPVEQKTQNSIGIYDCV